MRLLLLEDDLVLGAGLRSYLSATGDLVNWCLDLRAANAAVGEPHDVLLVDWQLPDGSGLDWVSGLRRLGHGTPVILLTARDLLSDRVRGLDAGADDYLVKPFEPEELSARIRAVRRRSAYSATSMLVFGNVTLDLLARSASIDGVQVELTAREWALAEALATRAGRIVSKADLDALVLGQDGDSGSNAIEVHVFNLRRKLRKDVIETVRGMGYRWVK